MERYIITFEDGRHFIADKLEQSDYSAMTDGLLTIIRLSDGKELADDGQWNDLPDWNNLTP